MNEQELQHEVMRLRAAVERSERKLAASEEALDHRQRQIDAMRHTTEVLFTQLSPDAMLHETIELAIKVLRADGGSVLLHKPDENVLEFCHVVGPAADRLLGVKLDLNKGVAGRVFRTGMPARVDNVHEDAEHNPIDSITGYRVDSMMSVPLKRTSGPCIGVINVVNARSQFDKRDLEVLEVMGSVAAAAIENARLAQEARKAAIVNVIGDISHDVKNMLTPIQTGVLYLQPVLAEMMENLDHLRAECPANEEWGKKIEQNLQSVREDYDWILQGALEASERVQSRVREIADAVKGEISPPHFEAGAINAVVLQVAQALRSVASVAEINLVLDLDEDLPSAEFDSKQLYNAVYNLVDNAISATASQGSVTVRTSVNDSQSLSLEVMDTGRGIPEQVRAKLFTEAAVSTKIGGTGLGTKIVGDVVRRHHGTIQVQSEEGKGSCFSVVLPRRQNVLSPEPGAGQKNTN